MDPVGPWSAYASYNRLAAGVQSGATSGDIHGSSSGAPSTTTATPILTGGFLSPAPVTYETVFTPLFHHAAAQGAKSAHYVAQHRAAAAKGSSDGDYHQTPAFFDQGTGVWQQNSPFGILPHESVVTTTASKTGTAYENFNANLAAAQGLSHLNTQLVVAKAVARAQSPQVSSAKTQTSSGAFFQVPVTFADTNSKTFTSSNSSNIQQSCIVSSASTTPVTKEYRVPQAPTRTFISSPRPEKSFSVSTKSTPNQIQTKPQTKIYSELANQTERQRTTEETQSQSSPISFSVMDAPGRLNYSGSNNSSAKRAPQFQHNYRHFNQQNANNESDFQRPKSSEYSTNGPDCNVVIPRRQSPLQAHSQASPLGHAPSPAYPMYNSPMNPISSPQQNQVTPGSPLDVSVPRPSPQGNVAYSSVITRALNTERYDRNNIQQNNQTQNCWDDRQGRKFNQNANNYNPGNSIEIPTRQIELPSRSESGQQRVHGYFDTNNGHQVQLQDLSSCRGDPMSIVKNLQQQSCQIQTEVKEEIKPPAKRRKSNDKAAAAAAAAAVSGETVPGRVPPPAHSATPQSQNGPSTAATPGATYYDLDRWNLPPAAATKIFAASQAAAAAAAIHHQHQHHHQGLMVPPPPHHPHAAHHLPYFTPFAVPHAVGAAAAAEYQSERSYVPAGGGGSVELTTLTTYQEQQQAMAQQQHQPGAYHHGQHPQPQPPTESPQEAEDQPKVVVPNIEEELNFLSQDNLRASTATSGVRPTPPSLTPQRPPAPPPAKPDPKRPGTDNFLDSYLKFINGIRDTSPPPAVKGSRKQQSWVKSRPPVPPAADNAEQGGSQGAPPQPLQHAAPVQPVIPPPVRLSTQGDPQDDPRYFPLPKERKRDSFDSSDDGFSSDDDFFSVKKASPTSGPRESTKRRQRDNMTPQQQAEVKKQRRAEKEKIMAQKQREQKEKRELMERLKREKMEKRKEKALKKEMKEKEEHLPRRTTTKRAAKEKITTTLKDVMKEDDEVEEPPEYQDSDSDPAWTPQAKEHGSDDETVVKKRRGRPPSSKKKSSRNLILAAAQCAGIDVWDEDVTKTKKVKSGNKNKQAPTLEDNIAASLKHNSVTDSQDDNPYKPGEFVAIKSELSQEWPSIWRVDGKALLQKYEPFEEGGITLYRNISTYTSWTPESRKQYVSIPVKYRSHGHLETVVEFLRDEMIIVDQQQLDRCMRDCEHYQDNFEVYIQTLISQALDSNFLTEIFQEKDEYFLSNVKTIDEITESKKQKLLQLLHWPGAVQAAVCTWPCFNVIGELNAADAQCRACQACGRTGVAVRVLMYGQPYNSTTLEGCPPDPRAMNEKDFLMCRICAERVELSNKVTHQKYLMYIECAKRVAEKRKTDPNKDTTCILNELLADESWLNQLFFDVRTNWAEIDCIEHSLKLKNSSGKV